MNNLLERLEQRDWRLAPQPRVPFIAVVALVVASLFALAACVVDVEQSAGPMQLQPATSSAAPSQASPDAAASGEQAEDDADTNDDSVDDDRGQVATDSTGLPVLGPAPGQSHWHAAYVVRICDQVLDPFDSTDDPLGIHSHADGLIHVHPFVDEAAFENATLDIFADAMGLEISEGEIKLPNGVTWRDGDLCSASKGRVFVDRWSGPGLDGEPERIFDDLGSIRFEADRELYQIAFAPEDSAPVVPPALAQLDDVSATVDTGDPWVDVPPSPDLGTVKLWAVAAAPEAPCPSGAVPERTLFGTAGCFVPVDDQFERSQAVATARAVSFNRRAGVVLTITDEFRSYLAGYLRGRERAVVAVEVAGEVVYAISYSATSIADDKLIVRSGLTVDSARALAQLFAI